MSVTFSADFTAETLPYRHSVIASKYILGGRQRAERDLRAGNRDWEGYDQARIVELDPQNGAWCPRVEYESAPGIPTAAETALTFQAGHVQGDELTLCTQNEVMVYRLPDFQRVWQLSLPFFNDVHHARPSPDGHVLVANAGLEMVLELTRAGEVRRAWNVLGGDPWANVAPDVDYRAISTKPHRAHPNYVFCLDDEIWATRFHQGDAVCLTQPHKRIPLSTERIHDGVVYDGMVYFTSVNGRIIVANPRTLKVEEVIDLTAMHDSDDLLGWCRGLEIHAGMLWVGFSRIRPTRFRENVSWVARGFKRTLPTRIALYDLTRRACVMEHDLEPMGIGAVYSILPVIT